MGSLYFLHFLSHTDTHLLFIVRYLPKCLKFSSSAPPSCYTSLKLFQLVNTGNDTHANICNVFAARSLSLSRSVCVCVCRKKSWEVYKDTAPRAASEHLMSIYMKTRRIKRASAAVRHKSMLTLPRPFMVTQFLDSCCLLRPQRSVKLLQADPCLSLLRKQWHVHMFPLRNQSRFLSSAPYTCKKVPRVEACLLSFRKHAHARSAHMHIKVLQRAYNTFTPIYLSLSLLFLSHSLTHSHKPIALLEEMVGAAPSLCKSAE